MNFETRILSSLEKVFPDQAPQPALTAFSCLQNEAFAFQVAVRPENIRYFNSFDIQVEVRCALPVTVKQVQYVPSMLPFFSDADGRYLTHQTGLFPDPLYEAKDGLYRVLINRWNSFFIEVLPGCAPAGEYPIELIFFSTDPLCPQQDLHISVTATLSVIGAVLPKSPLKYTCWFHGDCLADYYHLPVFSEKHWEIMENHIRLAAQRGQNMILTPLFTLPLDTQVGGERTTLQLVDVTLAGGSYHFDFTKLTRWIHLCQQHGIAYFEMSHLFTQWGAEACPKIMATVDGQYRQIFGWDNLALCAEYQSFLKAFLPQLTAYLTDMGLRDVSYFHISDEPHLDHLPQYLELKRFVAPLLDGFPIMDAMSDYSYYEQGVCETPVVATTAVDPFLNGKRPEDFWVYYCCGQGTNGLSNRFMAMPGYRTRILGLQCYRFEVKGFLQWGLNFYNSRYSLRHLNPFMTTDGDGAFPSGDAFVIYPGADGEAMESQRLVIFHEALQDLAALTLLESLSSREHVLALMEEGLTEPLSFTSYPAGEAYLLELRAKVNREIARLS